MLGYFLRRTFWAVFILWAIATTSFFATLRLGDPVAVIAGPRASARDRAHVRAFYGLDQPATVQYVRYVGHLVRGDLGQSFRYRRPVSTLIAERLPRTALLGVMAIAFEIIVGLSLGVLAASRAGSRTDDAVMVSSYVLMSMPTFLSGQLLLLGVAYHLGLLPVGGYGTTALEHVHHAILPAVTLALISTAFYARLSRAELLEMLRADFVRTARAKGLSERTILLRHALRNALLPVVTSLGMSVGSIFTGAVVTEAIFAWPGLGRLAYESITGLDVPVIIGTVLLGSFGIVLGNLLADLGYAALDPRIRRS